MKRWEVYDPETKRIFVVYAESAKKAIHKADSLTGSYPKRAGRWDPKRCEIVDDPNPGKLLVDNPNLPKPPPRS